MEVVIREVLGVLMHSRAVTSLLRGYLSCSVYATHALQDVNAELYGMKIQTKLTSYSHVFTMYKWKHLEIRYSEREVKRSIMKIEVYFIPGGPGVQH